MKLLVVMDPIEKISPKKDTTLALMLEAQAMGYDVSYCLITDLLIEDGQAFAYSTNIRVKDHETLWFSILKDRHKQAVTDFDMTLMRKDPPFDMPYIFATQILDVASHQGHLVVNSPSCLRNLNEKISISFFPKLSPPTIVSSDIAFFKAWINEHEKVVLKPLHVMGGSGIFLVNKHDDNLRVILETMTENGTIPIMGQVFMPEIKKGDKRILIIDGAVFPYGLNRIPAKGEFRANLAVGGQGEAFKLSQEDIALAERIGPWLKQQGALFVGLDVIGHLITEINVTSPTCVREISHAFNINIAKKIMTAFSSRH